MRPDLFAAGRDLFRHGEHSFGAVGRRPGVLPAPDVEGGSRRHPTFQLLLGAQPPPWAAPGAIRLLQAGCDLDPGHRAAVRGTPFLAPRRVASPGSGWYFAPMPSPKRPAAKKLARALSAR